MFLTEQNDKIVRENKMDRRQKKSREAIFHAFSNLLERKAFNNITVQEIIDEADVGRSTFYAHFDTKDELLREMCTDIFEHIFSERLTSESSHDFSQKNRGLEEELAHLLYHLRDNRGNIVGLFSSESSEMFLGFFREYLGQVFQQFPKCFRPDVPQEFTLNHLTGSFTEAVRWWMKSKMKESPETVVAYYLKLIEN